MAKFTYKMQNILNIKNSMETQAKTAYAEAANRLREEEDKLNELLLRRQKYENQCRELSSAILDIPMIQQCNNAIEIIKQMLKKQILAVRVAERNLDSARNRLNEAMKERKTHEKLKDNAFEEFKQEINAQEKKEIDELVSFTYNDKKKETGE